MISQEVVFVGDLNTKRPINQLASTPLIATSSHFHILSGPLPPFFYWIYSCLSLILDWFAPHLLSTQADVSCG